MERTTGVEPASKAWEAFILPMNYVRMPYGCCTYHVTSMLSQTRHE